MPCSVEPIHVGTKNTQTNEALKKAADEVTHHLDKVREELIATEGDFRAPTAKDRRLLLSMNNAIKEATYRVSIEDSGPFTGTPTDRTLVEHAIALRDEMVGIMTGTCDYDTMKARQIKHRHEDLNRVLDYALKTGDTNMFNIAAKCDILQPLKPQLGFDPDTV